MATNPPNQDLYSPYSTLPHLLHLATTRNPCARRHVLRSVSDSQLDSIPSHIWTLGLSRRACERVRLDLDEFRPWLDVETQIWLFGDFANLNEAVGELWQRRDEEFQENAWTRVTVVVNMLQECVRQDGMDREGCECSGSVSEA
jgi:hypothetical protein